MGVLTIAVVIGSGIVYLSIASADDREVNDSLHGEAALLRGHRLDTDEIVEPQRDSTISVIANSQVLFESPSQPLPPSTLLSTAARADASRAEVWTDAIASDGTRWRVLAQPVALSTGDRAVLLVSQSLREIDASLSGLVPVLVLVSIMLVGVGGALAYWLAGRVLRPIHAIAGMAQTLSERDLHRRITIPVPDDEMGQLVRTFNGMLARLEASFESLRQFTADASHELRAPLTVMRTTVEVTLARSRSTNEYIEALSAVLEQVDHLTRDAEQLLMLARADASALRPAWQELDVADFIQETTVRWEATAAKRHVRLVASPPEVGSLSADPALLRRVIDNLLDNALRYSPSGGTVAVRARPGDDGWLVEVADQGPGIPEVFRPHLFGRFAKLDHGRGRDGSGAGLGLALSAAIMKAHGGELILVTGGETGTTFRVRIPHHRVGPADNAHLDASVPQVADVGD